MKSKSSVHKRFLVGAGLVLGQLGDPGEPVELIEDSLGTFNESMLSIDYLITNYG